MPAPAPTLIIFHIGSIGDTVVMLPCLHAIARHYPHHRRILLTNKPDSARASSAESVLEGSGLIHGAEYFPARLASWHAAFSLLRRLRATRARTLVYLAPRTSLRQVRRDRLFFRLAGIRRMLGRPHLATDLERRHEPDGTVEAEAHYLARRLAGDLDVDLGPLNWSLHLSEAEQALAQGQLARLPPARLPVALCPGAKWEIKNWGEARWAELVRRLQHAASPISLVMVGAGDERALAQRLLEHWRGPALNLCGELTPRETAAVLGRCALLICHDSGPMHLAATQGTRCVALFGNLNRPRQWYPWGKQHRVLHDGRGVTLISVESVYAAVTECLGSIQIPVPSRRVSHLRVLR